MAKFTDLAIENCRKRFEDGEAAALFEAIDYCARSGTAMPVWLAEAFCSRYIAWLKYQVKTLDQAFGVERKGERIPERRERESLKLRVVIEVDKLHRQQGLPIDEALFELVGEALEIKPGMARDIYYKDNEWRRFVENLPRNPPPDLPRPTLGQSNPPDPPDDT
jgi:hypothetical protein